MKDINKEIGFVKYTKENEKTKLPLQISISNRKFRVSKQTGAKIGMIEGKTMIFFEFGKEGDWYIAPDAIGNIKGYKVYSISKRSGFEISASLLSRVISGRLGRDCVLQETNFEYQGKTVYKIEKRLL